MSVIKWEDDSEESLRSQLKIANAVWWCVYGVTRVVSHSITGRDDVNGLKGEESICSSDSGNHGSVGRSADISQLNQIHRFHPQSWETARKIAQSYLLQLWWIRMSRVSLQLELRGRTTQNC
jgi:hypothetical protein